VTTLRDPEVMQELAHEFGAEDGGEG
jgi:hypothetical protein